MDGDGLLEDCDTVRRGTHQQVEQKLPREVLEGRRNRAGPDVPDQGRPDLTADRPKKVGREVRATGRQ